MGGDIQNMKAYIEREKKNQEDYLSKFLKANEKMELRQKNHQQFIGGSMPHLPRNASVGSRESRSSLGDVPSQIGVIKERAYQKMDHVNLGEKII